MSTSLANEKKHMKPVKRSDAAKQRGYEEAQLLTDDFARRLLAMTTTQQDAHIESVMPTKWPTGEPIPLAQTLAWKEGYRRGIEERATQLRELKKPIWDGRRQSCRTSAEYVALRDAFDDIERAAEGLVNEAVRVANRMAMVRQRVFLTFTGHEPSSTAVHVRPRSPLAAVSHTGLNEAGELQQCDINRLCGVLKERQRNALRLVQALGYQLGEEEQHDEE